MSSSFPSFLLAFSFPSLFDPSPSFHPFRLIGHSVELLALVLDHEPSLTWSSLASILFFLVLQQELPEDPHQAGIQVQAQH